MSKNIFIDSYGGNVYAALAEENKLLEYHIESETTKKIVGNIYKGKVVNILNGMQAAFVDIGLDKNGYLFVGDMLIDKTELDGKIDIPTTLNMNIGDEIMVQAIKDPISTKGARLTSIISYAGRFLVYLPYFDFVGISRKITDLDTREKLDKFANKIKKNGIGIIMRTASDGISKKELKREYDYLEKLHIKTLQKYETSAVNDIIYEDGDLPVRMLRDVYTGDIEKIYVNSIDIFNNLTEEIKLFKTESNIDLVLYTGNRDMFKEFGLSLEVSKLLNSRVDLSSGAYLIFDKTEALTVIDVNTGKYIGNNDLEQTVFKTNILAAREIARQVRLRNISGIIVVDFIDMELQEHKQAVITELENALLSDRVKCNVVGMSPLGLVEFTRKKRRKDITAHLLKPCPYCNGDGKIYTNDYNIMKIRTELLDLFADGYQNAIIDLNIELTKYILTNGSLSRDVNFIWQDKRIYLVPHKTYHEHYFKIRGDNSSVLNIPENALILY